MSVDRENRVEKNLSLLKLASPLCRRPWCVVSWVDAVPPAQLMWINTVLFLLPGMVLVWWLRVLLVSERLSWMCFLWFAKYRPHTKLWVQFTPNQKISLEFRAINLVVVFVVVLSQFARTGHLNSALHEKQTNEKCV